jgi:hypothetical protein
MPKGGLPLLFWGARQQRIIASIEVEGRGTVLANGTPTLFWNMTKPFALYLEAVPEPCWAFKGWLVNGSPVEGERAYEIYRRGAGLLTVRVRGNTTIKAVFERPPACARCTVRVGGICSPLRVRGGGFEATLGPNATLELPPGNYTFELARACAPCSADPWACANEPRYSAYAEHYAVCTVAWHAEWGGYKIEYELDRANPVLRVELACNLTLIPVYTVLPNFTPAVTLKTPQGPYETLVYPHRNYKMGACEASGSRIRCTGVGCVFVKMPPDWKWAKVTVHLWKPYTRREVIGGEEKVFRGRLELFYVARSRPHSKSYGVFLASPTVGNGTVAVVDRGCLERLAAAVEAGGDCNAVPCFRAERGELPHLGPAYCLFSGHDETAWGPPEAGWLMLCIDGGSGGGVVEFEVEVTG